MDDRRSVGVADSVSHERNRVLYLGDFPGSRMPHGRNCYDHGQDHGVDEPGLAL